MNKTKQLEEWRKTEDRLFDLRKRGQDPHQEQTRNNRRYDGINRNRRFTATSLK